MFSQFYGLPANLWFPALDARVGSPLIDVLQQQDYQIKLFTSARLSYPEFDKTLLSRCPRREQMVEDDRANLGPRPAQRRQPAEVRRPARSGPAVHRPSCSSSRPHANDNFLAESAIEPDYLPDFSYASMDLTRDIKGIHNRYLNAVHHLDSQLARVTAHLESITACATTPWW